MIEGQIFADLPVFFPSENTPITDLLDPPAQGQPPHQNDIEFTIDLATGDVTADAPPFDEIIDEIDISDLINGLVGGFDNIMMLVEDFLGGEVFGIKLPFIGDKFSEAARFVGDIRQKIGDNFGKGPIGFAGLAQQKLFEAVGPGGLNWLQDVASPNDSGPDGLITLDDVLVNGGTADQDFVEFDMRLASDFFQVSVPLDFDIGIPALGLEMDGDLKMMLEFALDLGIGVSKQRGFYLVLNEPEADPELVVNFDITIPGLDAKGELLLLQLDVTDNGSLFGGTFEIDLVDVGEASDKSDGKLTLSELASGIGDRIDTKFSAGAHLDLHMLASLGGNAGLPSFGADFVMDWMFDGINPADPDMGPTEFGNAPEIAFRNMQLNLGEFFSSFAGPILNKINTVIDPVRPIFDALTTPIPVLSTMLGKPTTLLSMAKLYGNDEVTKVVEFVEAVDKVIDLLDIPVVDGDVMLDFGDFVISGDPREPGFSLSNVPLTDEGHTPGPDGEDDSESEKESKNKLQKWLEKLPPSMSLPILEDWKSLFGLFLGKTDVDLFLFDVPPLGFEFSYSQFIPIWGPFGAEITGTAGATFDFAFGVDTQGVFDFARTRDPIDLLNGFFVSDTLNPDGTGPDVPEIVLSMSLAALGSVNVGCG